MPSLKKESASQENLDHNLGRVREALNQSSKFKDNTLSVYFSDHGDYMGNHGAINRKENPHEQSVRVPAIFHWPNHIPATTSQDGLFGLADMLPTTLGLLGLNIPPHIQGHDFSPALRGEPFTPPDAQLIEMSGNPRWSYDFLDWRGLVTQRYKYAFYETGHEVLFDLESDPLEQTNLAKSSPKLREQMQQRLLDLLAETREPYFDVLIQHGVQPEGNVVDVSGQSRGPLSPHWDDLIQNSQDT
jgi:arylsulfatase A-like enzyme